MGAQLSGTTSATATASPGRAVAVLCGVQFVDVFGVTVVLTALPAMLRDLDAPGSAALVATGYAVFFGALLLLAARLGDRYGHRLVLQAGLVLFAAASLAAAVAANVTVLVLARCAQGAAAAVSVPAALRLLTAASPAEESRRRALAAWSATGAAAGGSGLLLGGVLTEWAGWRSLFWLNLPVAAVLLIAAARAVPFLPGQRTGPVDVAGAAVLTAAVGCLVLGSALLEQPGHRGPGALVLTVGAAAAILVPTVERRATDPLLPPGALRHPPLRVGSAASFANTATTSSAATLATLYLQDTRGFSPALTGLALLPFSLCVVAGAAVSARALRRATPRTVAGLGLVVIAAGDAALLATPAAVAALPVAVGVAGLGIGLSSVAATTLGTSVAEEFQGTAAGLLNTAAQLGTALGVAAILLVATAAPPPGPLTSTQLGWLTTAILATAAGGLLLAGPGTRRADRTGSAVG